MLDVTVVLVEGGAPSTAVVPVEVLSSAGNLWNRLRGQPLDPKFRVRTASQNGQRVQTGFNLGLVPDCSLAEVESTDLVVIAAVGVDLDAAIPAHAAVYPWLHERYREGAIIAGSCAGVPLIAESGLLDGACATTHWGVVDACRERYPQVCWQPEKIITDAGKVVCAGGVYSAVDLSLYLIEKLYDHQLAMQTAKALVLETPRTWQVGYATEPPAFSHDDAQIGHVQEWLFHHFNECVSNTSLAARANMSSRTFARRFKAVTGETVTTYIQKLRVNAARHLLENDLRSVQAVSYAVGYEDVNFFRALFKRYTGNSPRQYSDRFATRPQSNLALSGRTPQR